MNRAFWCVAATVVTILASPLFGAERRLLEPEEFVQDGKPLKRCPYFKEDATEWYARETNCRSLGGPGKGYSAAIHEGATQRIINAPLQRPLPPGKYQVFLSSAGLYWQDKPNIVRIRLGTASTDVSWTQIEKRIRWMPPQQIELKAPATTIALEAVQFGGKGFSKLYDINSRCILIDQVYLTSDLTEKTGPTAAGSHVVLGDRAAPAETIGEPGSGYREVNTTASPSPVAEPKRFPIRLASSDGRTNLIPNSSFELGGGDGWCTANNSRSQAVHIFSEADHVRDAFHGQYAIHLPGKGIFSMQYSRVFELLGGGTYTLSGYVKAIGGGDGKLNLRITPIGDKDQFEEADSRLKEKRPVLKAETETTAQWQRFSVTGPLEAGSVVMAVNGACLLDAVQLEKGNKATDYAPRAPIEASLSTDQLGHILYADKRTELIAWAHNSGAANATATLTYRIVDVRERVIEEKTLSIPVPAGKTVMKRVVVSPTRRGLFNVVYAAGGRPYADGELIYAVLPPIPVGMPRHALASNMDSDPASFELMKRMGHKWQLYCKLYADRPDQVNPNPDEYHWDALREIVAMPRPFGMKTMPAMWPTHVPAHLRDAQLCEWSAYGDGRRDLTRQIKNMAGRPAEQRTAVLYPDLKKWREYCRRLAENIGDEQPWWTVEDETELYYSAREFARIVRATANGFRDSGKPMKISLSCMTNYIDEMIAELGGDVPLSGFGASSYDYEYWEARKARYLQERWDVPWSCIGVGASRCPQFRRTGPFGETVYGDAVRTAQHMVMLAIGQDAKVLGHYTGRLWWRGSLRNNDFPLMDIDGTPLPHGFSYSCIPLLVADAVPVQDIYLDALRTVVFVFRQGGRLHAVTWSNNTPGVDLHWETDPHVWSDVRLPGAAGKVTVAGMYGNARDDATSDGADVVFDLDEEPTFFFNRGLTDESMLAMVRGITAAPRPLDMHLAFIPDGKGGVSLGVRATNNTSATLKGLKLDANFPPNRMLSRMDWTLPSRTGTIADIPAGQSVWGRLSTKIGPDIPVENATYTAWITDAQGREHRMYDTCWMTVAPRLTASLDGRLDEWQAVQPAWMHYTYAWDRFGRHTVQFERQGEHFNYVHRIDARAAIYAGHDDRHLYLAIRCEDDDLVRSGTAAVADRLEIQLNGVLGQRDGTQTLVLDPTADGVTLSGSAGDDARAQINVADARNEYAPYKVWIVEVAIPLSSLDGAKKPGDAIGLDVVWHDADHDGKQVVTGTWRWAGRSTGLGSMFFGQ
ncbi:MAG: hypothetical protein ISR77_35525 [Pirellulaceae bacterium]|nr:hypothetical protein [Pirellulaceae bacterium]